MACLCCTSAQAQGRKTPPGMFKDLDGEIVDQALLIHGKQLFLDDYVIDELRDAWKVLNQPVKHPRQRSPRHRLEWQSGLSSVAGTSDQAPVSFDRRQAILIRTMDSPQPLSTVV